MKIIEATWEKRNLGLDAFEVTLDRRDLKDAPGVLAALAARRFHGAYVLVKMPVGDLAMLHALEDEGFRFLETQLSIVSHFGPTDGNNRFLDTATAVTHERAPKEREAWERVIAKITPGMFEADRISLDPAFGPEYSCRRYQNWIRDLFADPRSQLHVLKDGGEEVGFAVGVFDAEKGADHGVLHGIFAPFKGLGYGLMPVYGGLGPGRKIRGIVSSNNLPVLRIVQYGGSIIYKEAYVLRKIYPAEAARP